METTQEFRPDKVGVGDRLLGGLFGTWIGDALAMPVHWYYDRSAMERDYGWVTDYLAPQNPHPDSIFWRSSWTVPAPELDILGGERAAWGQKGIHYHQNLEAGENTLSVKLAAEVSRSLAECGGYDASDYLRRYIALLTHPERHRDTYLEECHRGFFTNLGRGLPPEKCGVLEKHIGGLVPMLPVALFQAAYGGGGRDAIYQHLSLTHPGEKMRVAADAILDLLNAVFRGETLAEAICSECSRQRNPHFGFPFEKWLKRDDAWVIGRQLSTACYVDGAVPAVIYLALKYSGRPKDGLIANTNLGGDGVHRGGVLGALLGAEIGVDKLPLEWRNGLVDPPKPLSINGEKR